MRLLFFLDGCRRRVPGRQDFKDFAIFFCLQLFNYCIITYNYRMIALGKIPEAVGSDLLIGFCGFPPDVEIGWRFLPEYQGRGLATEAATAVMRYGFDTFQFDRLISVTQPANHRSLRVIEKLGMTFEKRFIHMSAEVGCYAKANPSGHGQSQGAGE